MKGTYAATIAIIIAVGIAALIIVSNFAFSSAGNSASMSSSHTSTSSSINTNLTNTPNLNNTPPTDNTTTSTTTMSSTSVTTITSTSNKTTSSTRTNSSTTTTSSTPGAKIGSIAVVGRMLNSTSPVNGIEVDLRVNGTDVAIGNTPVTFTHLQLGVQYGIVVYWYGNNYIRYINDSNTGMDLQRYDLVTLNQSNPSDKLTGYFENVPSSQAAALNIVAEYPNGTRIGNAAVVNGYDLHSSGMWLTVTPPFQNTPYTGTFTGGSILPFIFFNHETYTVNMSPSSCGPEQNINGKPIGTIENIWSHWQDGNTSSSRSVTLNGNQTIVAIYDQVNPANCAALSTSTTTTASSSSSIGQAPMGALLLASILVVFGVVPRIGNIATDFLRVPVSFVKRSQ